MAKAQTVTERIHNRRDNAGKDARAFVKRFRAANGNEERRSVVLQRVHGLMPKKQAAELVEREQARAERIEKLHEERHAPAPKKEPKKEE